MFNVFQSCNYAGCHSIKTVTSCNSLNAMTAHLQLFSCGAHRDRGKERWRNYCIQHSRNHFKEETEEYFSNSFVRNSMINTNMVQTLVN